MTEASMSIIVTEYLKERGYRVFAEVVAGSSTIDLVAVRPDLMYPVVIELKKSLTNHLIRQTAWKKVFTPFVWAVVGTRPRNTERITKHGIGVATVREYAVQVITKPVFERWQHSSKQCPLNYAAGVEDGEGGIQSPAPMQVVASRVRAYLYKHPRATRTEIFDNVPNHYASPRSMSGALRDEIGTYLPIGQRVEIPEGQLGLFR